MLSANLQVLLHAISVAILIKAASETLTVETELSGIGLQRFHVERLLTREQLVVELPKHPLLVRTITGLGGLEGFGVTR